MRAPPPPSCVSVKGLLRASEKPSGFVPDNAGKEWFWIDVPALAAAAGLPPSTRLVEVINPSTPAGGAAAPPQALTSYPSVRACPALSRSRTYLTRSVHCSRRTRLRFCAFR
jgi:cytochrome oxidase assembly protein ShyY1